MLEHICRSFGISPGQICMVGDRLDTDIAFGQAGGAVQGSPFISNAVWPLPPGAPSHLSFTDLAVITATRTSSVK